jgi:hypothetical protein
MNWFKKTKLFFWLRCLIFGCNKTKLIDMENYITMDIDSVNDIQTLKSIAKAWQEKAFLTEVKLFLKNEQISNEQLLNVLNIDKVKTLMNIK